MIAAELSWIIRIIIILLIVRMVMQAFRGTPTQRRPSGRPGPRPQAPRGPVERIGGRLVRDPQCGTHVAESRAIKVVDGTNTLYFCSERCRDLYRAAHSSVA